MAWRRLPFVARIVNVAAMRSEAAYGVGDVGKETLVYVNGQISAVDVIKLPYCCCFIVSIMGNVPQA